MGDYLKIHRTRGRRKRYFAVAFNEFDYEYRWRSPLYRWLWLARWKAPKDARTYINAGLREIGGVNPLHGPQHFRTSASIERIDL